ncbi:MAG: ABC transporter substrate-binding protein, partial [Ilumatobacteraceae bacterium]
MAARRSGTARTARFALAGIAVTVGVAACTNGDGDDPRATAATTTSTIVDDPVSDGVLTIGVMRPPASSLLRETVTIATEQAIAQINDAGGSFGGPVRLVPVDEGETVSSARDAIEELIDQDVDAVVGPMSSVIALGTLETITSAGMLACSPTATALALDDFPDRGMLIRTVPSDSMQATAIAQVAEETGVQAVTIVYVDDAYGRPLSEAVADGLSTLSIDVGESIGFASGDTELSDEVQRVLESGSGVVILLADSTDGTQFLEALSDEQSSQISTIIVNDALRAPESSQRLSSLRPSIRQKLLGVAPQAEDAAAPFDPPGPFATNAFDCVTLIALAAGIAGSDRGADIARVLPSVSTGGQPCNAFAECYALAQEETQINYNGPSGLTDIGPAGDPIRARFDQFSFDVEGNDTLSSEAID